MRILLTGSSGQVGFELLSSLPLLGQVIAPSRAELDLSQAAELSAYLDEHRPDLIVNPGAYTAVDRAQEQSGLAHAINRDAPQIMADWCCANDASLVHYSTDYVYSGQGQTPFSETASPDPVGVYGASKLAGDQAVIQSGAAALIFRTSWVYSARGGNFLDTMLRVAQTRDELKVVDDQIGAPTPARLIADVTMAALLRAGGRASQIKPFAGIYHLVPTGFVSWHGFAAQIMDERAQITGLVPPRVLAIPSSEYPTPAKRPANSRLSTEKLRATFDLTLPSWHQCLRPVIEQRLAHSQQE